MIPYFMKFQPQQNCLFSNICIPVNPLKHHNFSKIIESSIEVKYLGAIPGMKFIMDECCGLYWEEPPRIINAVTFYEQMGFDKGQSDSFLLDMATRYGYTIVTRDRGLVLRAYEIQIPIIYRLSDLRLFLVETQKEKKV